MASLEGDALDEGTAVVEIVLVLAGDDVAGHEQVVQALVGGGLAVQAVALREERTGKGKRVGLVVRAGRELVRRLVGARGARVGESDAVRAVVGYVTRARFDRPAAGLGVRVAASAAAVALANARLPAEWTARGLGWVGGGVVADVLVLHDAGFEAAWRARWEAAAVLSLADIAALRDALGEAVAFHFAFLLLYLQALAPLAAVGTVAQLLFPAYSHLYAALLALWSIGFLQIWSRQERLLADKWRVDSNGDGDGDGDTDNARQDFLPDYYYPVTLNDNSTTYVPYYPFWKRWLVHGLCTLPLILAFAAAVSAVSAVILVAEVYSTQLYLGPNPFFKLLPNVIYAASLPLLQLIYNALSKEITTLENSQSSTDHTASLTTKTFIITLLLTQLPLILTGLVFVPVSDLILPFIHPYLLSYGVTHADIANLSQNLLSPASLRDKVFGFAVTSQILGQLAEVLGPVALAWYSTWTIQISEKTKEQDVAEAKKQREEKEETEDDATLQRQVQQQETLRLRIEKELALPEYNPYDDYAELANQFALLTMFSAAWPLVSLFCLANNFADMRTHAYKIAHRAVRRPLPQRVATIAPWSTILHILGAVGAITTAVLTSLYRHWDPATASSAQTAPRIVELLIVATVHEHLHFIAKWIVGVVVGAVWGDLQALSARRRAFEQSVIARFNAGVLAGGVGAGKSAEALKKIFGTGAIGADSVDAAALVDVGGDEDGGSEKVKED
ncbi:hypothetical protein HK100_007853 [Physocladia obscura]|uniref:Anoctamin transmembrane domain-containing protein n=1 Tax=Physocladia obscura TaxID=109957 RepID=A0AAD5X6P1_9FUNG|nr:hypothetical protein HK100_007853 [Physocladia obscura]